jgi:phage terminase small subunit
MPINDKQKHFIREYTTNGHNATKAYKTAYPDCNIGANVNGSKLLANTSIKAEIDRIEAETGARMDISRKAQYKRLLAAYDMAVTQGNVAGIKGILSEINLMQGYQRENAPNKEMEQAIADRMSSEDKELARVTAKIRTDEEARKHLKLA